jgi:hypothetical protein
LRLLQGVTDSPGGFRPARVGRSLLCHYPFEVLSVRRRSLRILRR